MHNKASWKSAIKKATLGIVAHLLIYYDANIALACYYTLHMRHKNIPALSSSTLLLLLPVVSAWLFVPQLSGAFDIKHHFAVVAAILSVLVLTMQHSRKLLLLPKSVTGVALLIWVAAVLISSIAADNAYLVTRMLAEFFAFLLLALTVANFPDKTDATKTLEGGIMIAGAGVAIFALKQYFLPDFLDPGFHALGKMKVYSTLGNSNLAALVILAGVPSAAWRAWRGSAGTRALYGILTLLLLAGIIATQARHALLAAGVALLVALLWLGSHALRKRLLVLVSALAVAGAGLLIFAHTSPSLTHSINGRLFIWFTALQMLWDHPFTGVGLGHFGLKHLAYQSALFSSGQFNAFFDNAAVISEGHNDFLNWGAMSGILGITGFTLLCAGILWKGWHSAALKQHAPQLYLAFVAYVVAMFFVAVTSYTVPALFFWLLLGMIMAHLNMPVLEWAHRPWLRYSLPATLGMLLLACTVHAVRETRSDWYTAQGDKRMQEHDLWLANKEYQQALALNPHNSAARKRFATILFLEGNMQQSIAELEVAKRYSGDLGLYLLEGEIRTRTGDFEHAARLYRQITAAFPNMISPHFILGQIYLLQEDKARATREFKQVIEITPPPFNLNMTHEKVELQKQIVRDYLQGNAQSPPTSSGWDNPPVSEE
jgi:O-antigen ligase